MDERLSQYALIAELAGEPLGYLIAQHQTSEFADSSLHPVHFHEDEEGYLEVQEVYVAPSFRKQGIGSTLVDTVLVRARRNGVSHSVAYTANKDWQTGVAFYEHCGYRTWRVALTR